VGAHLGWRHRGPLGTGLQRLDDVIEEWKIEVAETVAARTSGEGEEQVEQRTDGDRIGKLSEQPVDLRELIRGDLEALGAGGGLTLLAGAGPAAGSAAPVRSRAARGRAAQVDRDQRLKGCSRP
jgi:hypothetical protein